MPTPHHTIKVNIKVTREVDDVEVAVLADQSVAGPEPVSAPEMQALLEEASAAAAEEYGNSI